MLTILKGFIIQYVQLLQDVCWKVTSLTQDAAMLNIILLCLMPHDFTRQHESSAIQ